MQEHVLLHTRRYVEIDKYTKNKLRTKLTLFTRLYRDARSTKQKHRNACSNAAVDKRTSVDKARVSLETTHIPTS